MENILENSIRLLFTSQVISSEQSLSDNITSKESLGNGDNNFIIGRVEGNTM